MLALLPLISLLYTVVDKGIESLNIDFFTKDARGVIGAGGGAKHAILGTLIITGLATVISVPDRADGGDLPERVRRVHRPAAAGH